MKPIRYGQWRRWTDAFHGRRDGRAGIPAKLPAGAPAGPVTTPHREALIRLAQDAFSYEHLAYTRLVAEPHRRIRAEQARLEAARSALTWAMLGFDADARTLTAAETTRRRLGEEHQPETVIVQRRRNDHQKLLSRSRSAVTRAQADIAAIEADLGLALQEAQQHHQAAVIRVERIHEHIHRRLAVYRRALVRAHPDGAWVNAVLSPQAPEIPGWALPDAYGPEGVQLPSVVPDENPEPAEPEDEPLVKTIELRHPATRFGSARPALTHPPTTGPSTVTRAMSSWTPRSRHRGISPSSRWPGNWNCGLAATSMGRTWGTLWPGRPGSRRETASISTSTATRCSIRTGWSGCHWAGVIWSRRACSPALARSPG